jgi:hypothetical protein
MQVCSHTAAVIANFLANNMCFLAQMTCMHTDVIQWAIQERLAITLPTFKPVHATVVTTPVARAVLGTRETPALCDALAAYAHIQ